MLLRPQNQEALCMLSNFVILGLGALVIIIFGGTRMYNKKGWWLSPILIIIGVLIGIIIPITDIANWIFFMGNRGELPVLHILIGLVLIIVSFFIPAKKDQREYEPEDPKSYRTCIKCLHRNQKELSSCEKCGYTFK